MKKECAFHLLLSVVCVFLALTLSSCSTTNGNVHVGIGDEPAWEPVHVGKGPPPHAPAHGYRAKYRYRYYPDSYVYFDINRRLYFYLQDNDWRVSGSLPSDLRVRLGEYVTVDLDTDKPYLGLQEHKHTYPPGQMKKKNKQR